MKKVCLSTLIIFLFASQSMSQQGLGNADFVPNYKDFLTRIPPSSPEASAFQKYGDIPVDITSGSQQISIPFTTLKVGNFSWPLSLSYHTNGVKVSEVSTITGLGWVLNAGGIISQKLVGANDIAMQNLFEPYTNYLELGSFGGAGGCHYGNFSDAELATGLARNEFNGLPDLFYLNDPLHSMKFFIKNNDSGYAMPASAAKLKYNRNLDGNKQTFSLVDDDGNQYFYNLFGFNSTTTSCTFGPHNWSPQGYIFYLTTIITNQKQRIDFSYSDMTNGYSMPKEEVYYEPQYDTSCIVCSTHKPTNYTCTSTQGCHEKRLDSIKCSTGEFAIFKYSSRSDITGSYKLDSLLTGYQLGATRSITKKWALTYSYFNNDSPNQDMLRLKLSKVSNLNTSDSSTLTYALEYDSVPLPSRLSFAVDSFGFYNGKNSNTTFLTNRADRSSNINYISAGTLKKITYPTGGYSIFQYGINKVCGGNQLEKIMDFDNYNDTSNLRTYVYKTSTTANIRFYDNFNVRATATSPGASQPKAGCPAPEYIICNGVGGTLTGYKCFYRRYKSTSVDKGVYESYASSAKYDTVYEYFGLNAAKGYKQYILGYPKNYENSNVYFGTANRVVKTNTYIFNSPNSYSLSQTEIDSFMFLPVASNLYLPPLDSRTQYAQGVSVEIDREEVETSCNSGPGECVPRTFLANYFWLYSTPLYKTSSISIKYNNKNQDSLKSVVNYFYSDKPQYNPVKITTTNSKGEIISGHKKYVADIVKEPNHDKVYDSLSKRNRNSIEIVDSVVKNPNIQLALTKTNFSAWNGELFEPSLIQQSFNGGSLVDQVSIALYDNKGNLVQAKGKDGVTITYLYGYSYNFPVAKITGADYNTVMAQLTSLGATNDARYIALQNINNSNALKSALSILWNIPNAFVTIYTYNPFVGISSETNSNNLSIYYDYDGFGRTYFNS